MKPDVSSVVGVYISKARIEAMIGYSHPHIVYRLTLEQEGTFEASYVRTIDGVRLTESSLRDSSRDPHEVLHGTWHLSGERIVLESGDKRYEATVRRLRAGWCIVWDGVEYYKKPNQALQPTRMLVTFRACARPAPSTRVADL